MSNDDPTPNRWVQIPGLSRPYEISDGGDIRNPSGRILNPRINQALGYRQIELRGSDGKQQSCYIHALVLEAFVGPRPDGAVVRHLNGNPLDNRLENLQWGTPAENAQDRVRHGRDANARKTHCFRGHPISGPEADCRVDKNGGRQCRACDRITHRLRRDRNPERRKSTRVRDPKTHCKRGHEFTPENTYSRPKGRECKACRSVHRGNFKARKAA